jgi:hypothetical protein
MKDLLEKLIGLIPAFFNDLLPLISSPKRYIAEQLSQDEKLIERALLFFGMCFSIGWLLKVPFSRADPLVELGTDASFVLLNVIGYGIVLYLAWRIVGGRGEKHKFFATTFYYAGVMQLLSSIVFLSMMGTIRATDPTFYKEMLDATYAGNFASFMMMRQERLAANPVIWVALAGYAGMLTWVVAGWGAYRKLNQVSRLRSCVAGVVFFIFAVPVAMLMFVIGNALLK